MERDWSKYQEEVFGSIVSAQYELRNMSASIQNDFTELLKDGIATKSEIEDNIPYVSSKWQDFIDKISDIRDEVVSIHEHFAK